MAVRSFQHSVRLISRPKPLQQSLNDLEQAYQNFFKFCKGERKGKLVRPPKFKKRRSAQSARFRKGGFKVHQQGLFAEEEFPRKKPRSIYLAKVGKLQIVWSRPLPAEPSSVTVIKDAASRYFVSFVVEIEPSVLPKNNNAVGVDLGIATFATLSTGEKIDAPKPLKKRITRVRRLSKNLFRKTIGSNRYEKARKRDRQLTSQTQGHKNRLSTQTINQID